MKTKKAVNIIHNQIIKLDNKENHNHNWILETRTYLKNIFGEDSPQEKSLHYFSFEYSPNDIPLNEKIVNQKQFLNNCINTVKNIGVYKPKKENWFSELPNWSINLGLPALCFLAFSAGVLFTNNNNSDLRKKNKRLNERLLLVPADTITNQHKNLSNSPTY